MISIFNKQQQFVKAIAVAITLLFFTACSDDKAPEEVEQAKTEITQNQAVETEILQEAKPVIPKVIKPSKETAAIKTINAFITEQAVNKINVNWKQKLNQPPQANFVEGDSYYWNLKTNKGNMSIRLMPDVAPMHVSSTIYLTNLGFYDGIIFHRVIPGFMAQGGDPIGQGSGNPGYKYEGEFSDKAVHDKPGILSMANAGAGTDGSQFFITYRATPHLDNKHTVFGEVVKGMDTLKRLEEFGSSPYGKTTEKLEIVKATIRVE